MESGDNVVCARCRGLVPRARAVAHHDYWCPMLPNNDDDDDDDDAE